MKANDLKWLEQEIKVLIVGELGLEDIDPEDIDSDMPLFGGGLGLSSINALELDTALQKRFAAPAGRAGSIDLFRYSTVRLLAEHLGDALSSEDQSQPAPDVGARRRAAMLQKTNSRNS